MRITLDITSAVKPNPTGIGNYISDLVRALLELDRENWYTLGIRPKRFLRRQYVQNLGQKARAPILPLLPPYYPLLVGKIDVFHALGVRLPAYGGFRRIVTIHDLNTIDNPEFTSEDWSKNRARRIRETVSRADGIITPSEFTKQRLIEKFPQFPHDRIRAVWHGVDLERYRPRPAEEVDAVKKKYGLDKPYVLHAGAYVPRKNKLNLVRAYAQTNLRQNGLLALAGYQRGNFAEIEQEVNELGLQDKVKYLGFVGRDEVAALLCGARVFAFPSLYEGFGLPILEAMATGTPTVAANASCLPEVGETAVVYFDPNSPTQMAQVMDEVWQDEAKRQGMIRLGHERAKRLTWQRAAQETLAFYQYIAALNKFSHVG